MNVIKKLKAGNTVYLKEDFEDAVIRIEPSGEYFVKLKGKEEFKTDFTNGIISQALEQPVEISETEYLNF